MSKRQAFEAACPVAVNPRESVARNSIVYDADGLIPRRADREDTVDHRQIVEDGLELLKCALTNIVDSLTTILEVESSLPTKS